MRELAPGLWTWSARHPEWSDDEDWGPDVRSYALETEEGVILFDPVAPPDQLTAGRSVAVALTAEWHGRDAARIGARIHRDDLPRQVAAQPAFYPGERTLWIPAHGALVVGDSLPNGNAVPDRWLGETPRDEYNAKLQPLLELPVQLLLPTHGDPVLDDARGALARALG